MNAIDYIETHHPAACPEAREWLRSLPEDTTLDQAWAICPDPTWMLWLLSKSSPTVEQGYICADLAIGWAADALDLAGIPHGLRDLAPITDRETAAEAVGVAVGVASDAKAAADAAWTARAAAKAAWAAETAETAADAAWVAWVAWAAARAAFCAINTGPDPVKMADQIRARIACPYKEIEL